MDNTVKLKASTMDVLKKMNNTYPSTTVDYDKLFLFDLLRAVFTENDLLECGTKHTIQHLNRPKLKFVKGVLSLIRYLYHCIYFIKIVFSLILQPYSASALMQIRHDLMISKNTQLKLDKACKGLFVKKPLFL